MFVARRVGLAVPLTVCLLLSTNAWSAPKVPTKAERAAARDAYDKGTLAFEKGDYTAALDGFMKANAIIPSIQAAYWIALAHDRLGHTETAIKAYEEIQAREDFSKLSPDKATIVRDRLTALKSPPPPPPPVPAPPVEAPPPAPPPVAATPEPAPIASEPPPPAVVNEPPPVPITPNKLLPQANTVELGIALGTLFVANSNNLVQDRHSHAEFEKPVWELGLRGAYFPAKFIGIEAEWQHGFGRTNRPAPLPINSEIQDVASPAIGRSARFDTLRGHLIGQLPDSQFVPFALLGAGVMHVNSDLTGADTDVALHAGVGAKMYATKLLVPRIDLRLNMTQRRGGGFSDGLSVHPEILLGLAFRLGG